MQHNTKTRDKIVKEPMRVKLSKPTLKFGNQQRSLNKICVKEKQCTKASRNINTILHSSAASSFQFSFVTFLHRRAYAIIFHYLRASNYKTIRL